MQIPPLNILIPIVQKDSLIMTGDFHRWTDEVRRKFKALDFHGARIDKTTGSVQSLVTATPTIISFDAEIFDNAADEREFADLATSATKLTIPSGSGILRAVLTGGCHFASHATGERELQILKNGTTVVARVRQVTVAADDYLNVSTGPLLVVEGDYFELRAEHTAGTNIDVNANEETFLAIHAF